jgi:mannose-6-phosphate isomerase-like protein (cupin superfamily)
MKIVHSRLLPSIGTSHNGEIKKKVFIGKGEIPHLMNFGTAILKPGQFVETHRHPTMFEVFHIQRGRVQFVVENEKLLLREGDCITIAPQEAHSQDNPFQEEVELLYFGIAIDSPGPTSHL